jgi:transposase-like protein
MERRQRRIFREAFKREAVDRVASSGLSPGRVAAELVQRPRPTLLRL